MAKYMVNYYKTSCEVDKGFKITFTLTNTFEKFSKKVTGILHIKMYHQILNKC